MKGMTVALGTLAVLGALATGAAGASVPGMTASIANIPPTVQHVGRSYYIEVIIRTRARGVRNLCVDFDDDNSWLFRVPGLREYAKDTFCFGYLRPNARKGIIAH